MINKKEKKSFINDLDKVLDTAKMSPDLRTAVFQTKQALLSNNVCLAEEITSVKSLVGNKLESKSDKRHFQEDSKYNYRVLDNTVYSILDDMHFDLAMKLKKMPRGMTKFTAQGRESRETEPPIAICIREQPLINSNSTVRLMRQEFQDIRKY